MRKLVRTPPISTAIDDSLGKPCTSAPISVVVPPTSITMASSKPVRKAAPRMLLVGPEPNVRTGNSEAKREVATVPSFGVT